GVRPSRTWLDASGRHITDHGWTAAASHAVGARGVDGHARVRTVDGSRTLPAKFLGPDGDRWRLRSRPRAHGVRHAAARRLSDGLHRAGVSRVVVPARVIAGWRSFRSTDH